MIEMTVPSMSCGGCARSIAKICAAVDPAAKVEADPRAKLVRIESAEPRDRFVEALSAGGYPPQ